MLTYLFLSTFENTFIPNTNIWHAKQQTHPSNMTI